MAENTKKAHTVIQPPDATPSRELEFIRHALDKSAIVVITDHMGKVVHVNDKFCDISKYSREEMVGQTYRVVNSGHHPPEFFKEMWDTISRGKIWEGEIRNRAKDGRLYWVNTTIVPFLNEAGEPYQYVSIRFEITQRKDAEEQLRVYAERLEESNRELQEFASVAAHDLHEPLRKIQSFGERLNTRFRSELSTEGVDFMDRMLASANRMRVLIDDLLSYSKAATNSLPLELTDLNEVIRTVLSDLEIRIEQVKGIINVEKLPTLQVDHSQMRQLFQNLIGNALKFRRDGIPPVVAIGATTTGDSCVLSVVDNGIGFDEKYLNRIFSIFQRLHGKHEYEGTGIGLAVCRRIAERHGGSITAESTPGEGASFFVTLPLKH